MIRMRVKNVCVGFGPIPSGITLQAASEPCDGQNQPEVSVGVTPEESEGKQDVTPNVLPLRIAVADAAAIAAAVESSNERPLTHTLLNNTIKALGGRLESVSITRVEHTTFFATLDIKTNDGAFHHIDARPSDAVALALSADVPIMASEELLAQAGSPDFEAIEKQEQEKLKEEFHDFVETLSPEDFIVRKDN